MAEKTFTEVVFTVNTGKPEGNGFRWTGIASEFFPGLVVHDEIAEMLDDEAEYVVSHLPTGFRVPTENLGALSLAEALDLAASLAALTDWSQLQTVDDVHAWGKSHRDELQTLLGTAPEDDSVEDTP